MIQESTEKGIKNMSINYKLIGTRIKETRISKRMSQEELAEQVDRSVSYISHIERGVKRASLETLILTANTLDITVDALLNGNQANDIAEYHVDLSELFRDCDSYEKRVIYQNAVEQKRILRENKWLKNRHDQPV